MTDSSLDLLNKAIKNELDASIRYMWQYLTVETSDIKGVFKKNALKKFRRAMKIGEHLFRLGHFPDSVPEEIGNSLKEMIERDLKAEKEVLKVYQKIAGSEEVDSEIRELCEDFLQEVKEQKRVLMCAQGRADKKLV